MSVQDRESTANRGWYFRRFFWGLLRSLLTGFFLSVIVLFIFLPSYAEVRSYFQNDFYFPLTLTKFERFADDRVPQSAFCGLLSGARRGSFDWRSVFSRDYVFNSPKNGFENRVAGADPRGDLVRSVFKTTVSRKQFKILFRYILGDVGLELTTNWRKPASWRQAPIVRKAKLYGLSLLAGIEFWYHRAELEDDMDRLYLLLSLNNLASRTTRLSNLAVSDYCLTVEKRVNAGKTVRYESEKKEFEKLLADLGINATADDYDPQYRTRLAMDFDSKTKRPEIKLGWLKDLLRGH